MTINIARRIVLARRTIPVERNHRRFSDRIFLNLHYYFVRMRHTHPASKSTVLIPTALLAVMLLISAGCTAVPSEQQNSESESVQSSLESASLSPDQFDPAAKDPDADGVPSNKDNCPRIPNPRVNGVQDNVCGDVLRNILDRRVFLKSRVFTPTTGVDPKLRAEVPGRRIHVLLHVNINESGVVLTRRQKQQIMYYPPSG